MDSVAFEKKKEVLVVDDSSMILSYMRRILDKIYTVHTVSSGEECLEFVKNSKPDLILLDFHMTGIDGLEVLHSLKANKETNSIPVIFLTGSEDLKTEMEGLRLGAVDYIRKPYAPDILTLRIRRTIELSRLRKDLSREVDRTMRENTRLSLHVVQTLAAAIDAKDTYTNGHSDRVAAYSREIAKRLGYDAAHQDEIYMMGLLHDVGKIGVPDEIINKTDRLTDEEFEKIKEHPVVGDRILKKIREMPKLSYGARWHHERVDGRGYPDGLKGNDIPEEARIIAVADAYDAMTSNRSYRKGMSQERVREELEKGKDSQFDRRIADVMLQIIDEDKDYRLREESEDNLNLRKQYEEETVNHMDLSRDIPEEILGMDSLDVAMGLYLCGDAQDYMEALSIFAASIEAKAEKIEQALRQDDIDRKSTRLNSSHT